MNYKFNENKCLINAIHHFIAQSKWWHSKTLIIWLKLKLGSYDDYLTEHRNVREKFYIEKHTSRAISLHWINCCQTSTRINAKQSQTESSVQYALLQLFSVRLIFFYLEPKSNLVCINSYLLNWPWIISMNYTNNNVQCSRAESSGTFNLNGLCI